MHFGVRHIYFVDVNVMSATAGKCCVEKRVLHGSSFPLWDIIISIIIIVRRAGEATMEDFAMTESEVKS